MQLQLTIPLKAGISNRELAADLRVMADKLEAEAPAKKSTATTKKQAAAVDEDDDGFTADTTGEPEGFDDDAPAAASFDEEEKPAAKKGKTKKLTLDDVNDACKAHAAAKGRPATLAVLQKKFKTQSVSALKPEQYEACISAMAVN